MNVEWMRRYERGGARDGADCWERNGRDGSGGQRQHRHEVKRLRLWLGCRKVNGRIGVAGPGAERRMRRSAGVMMG